MHGANARAAPSWSLSEIAGDLSVNIRTILRGQHITAYHLCRNLRDDGISVGAQASHSGGYPMSQRECAGFNRPPFSVSAGYPFCIAPEASQTWRPRNEFVATFCASDPSFQSLDIGVAHIASFAAPGSFRYIFLSLPL